MSCSHIQWKRHCLSLPSAMVPMPSFPITMRIQFHSHADATILSLSVPLHNPEYFGRSSSYFSFSYFTIYITLWQLCLRDPEFNILDARVFRAYFYASVHYEYPRGSIGSKTYSVTRYICVYVCTRGCLCVHIKLQKAKVQCKMW